VDDGTEMRKLFIVLITIICGFLYSQSSNYGGGPNAFYQHLYTARQAAMGGTGIANADGYLAFLWNPAAVSNNFVGKTKFVAGIHSALNFGGISNFNNNLDFRFSDNEIDWGGAGINWKTEYGFKNLFFGAWHSLQGIF